MEKKIKKEWCKRCNGVGHWMGKYGMTACDDCNGKGFKWREVRKYTKKPVKIISSNLPVIKSFFCGLKAEGYQKEQCEFTCRYCRLGKHPQKYV